VKAYYMHVKNELLKLTKYEAKRNDEPNQWRAAAASPQVPGHGW
jgi:hypothetical protein